MKDIFVGESLNH